MPVIILGGLYGGLFTPTEAGAAAASYALFYGLIFKRKTFIVPVRQFKQNLREHSDYADRKMCTMLL